MTASEPGDQTHSVARSVRMEIAKVKGSRFICDLAPSPDEVTAVEFVDSVRAREPSATHHCWAYRLSSGIERSSDDGEPAGTAGPPILRRLRSAGLIDTVAVVTRYYGGVNLGTGGLIRAYGAATGAAIDMADTVRRTPTAGMRLTHPYDLSSAVEQVMAEYEAVVMQSAYTDVVSLSVEVPATHAGEFAASIQEATAGVVRAEPIDRS